MKNFMTDIPYLFEALSNFLHTCHAGAGGISIERLEYNNVKQN